ncbi:hypothetical protein J41TS12_42790 [Paenibacillus antibioticophila]|uniref:Uncharacterized protein n=1 Tax=Paenibacillus antibioticophila TaxID=1274374 RepID=A0A920CJ62_9BACL|nr:hypothetical protein J41TS12_42790 [Paenibacillus antibioticophila]
MDNYPQNYPQQILQKLTRYVYAQCTSRISIMQFSHCSDSQRAVLDSMTTVERPHENMDRTHAVKKFTLNSVEMLEMRI